MNVQIKRKTITDLYTAGELYIDGVFKCWTLEDKIRDLSKCGNKVYGETAIPAGQYSIILSFSTRFQKYMPEIPNVPCFTGIRIHSGNTVADTDGCILVGAEKSADGRIDAGTSRPAFLELMKEFQAVEQTEKISLTVL